VRWEKQKISKLACCAPAAEKNGRSWLEGLFRGNVGDSAMPSELGLRSSTCKTASTLGPLLLFVQGQIASQNGNSILQNGTRCVGIGPETLSRMESVLQMSDGLIEVANVSQRVSC
jgi:hypothetical protein